MSQPDPTTVKVPALYVALPAAPVEPTSWFPQGGGTPPAAVKLAT